MEPRSTERGNSTMRHGQTRDFMLQWSHAQRAWKPAQDLADATSCLNASMEPRSASVETRGAHSTARKPTRASMEPRSASVETFGDPRGQSLITGFNGATLNRAWKPDSGLPHRSEITGLQWSHAQPNVETSCVTRAADAYRTLQWSHAQRAWKRVRSGSRIHRRDRFNGATLSERGNIVLLAWIHERQPASMEPRSASVETNRNREIRRLM